ncbi:MAG: protein-tyrosine-phosphatase, partial [Bacteroidota bacterium]
MDIKKQTLTDSLQRYIHNLEEGFGDIPAARKEHLQLLSNYLTAKYEQESDTPELIVICTHNSRRSHMGAIWLGAAADYYELPTLKTYSGGTEATAFNPRAVAAMRRAGFDIQVYAASSANPNYHVSWTPDGPNHLAFSKKYDAEANPASDFAAIMVCNSADEACPFVPGADFRLALPFDDPKAFDDTPQEEEKYDERCAQIGREMLWVLKQVK